MTSVAGKIGCTSQTLHDWGKKAAIDSGQRAGACTTMFSAKKRASVTLRWGSTSPLAFAAKRFAGQHTATQRHADQPQIGRLALFTLDGDGLAT